MKNRLLIIILLLQIHSSCADRKAVIESFSGFAQGTTYSIVYDNNKNISSEKLKVNVEKILHDFDMSLSIYQDSSIISKLNRNETAIPDSFFLDVFDKSVIISRITGGAFDITVGPLVRAWGFGPDALRSFTPDKRDSLMRLVGIDKVSIRDGRLLKSDPGIFLDVNAIAQGYSVDVINRYFNSLGFKNYLIEIGGEVRAKGTRDGAHWRIGIDKPADNNMSPGKTLQAIIRISDRSLATSGNYRKFFVEDGIKYSHTIDPRTGYPVKNTLLSATIVTDECIMADGIATACMVMGTDSAIEFIKNNPQYSAYFVFSDEEGNFETWASESLKEEISEPEN